MTKRSNKEQIVRTKAAQLMEQVQSLGLLLKASVVRRRFRCGKPGCRCVKGHLHQDMIVTRKAGGRTQTIRVRQGRETEALAWLENWRRLKQILFRLTAVEMQILRMPVQGTKSHAPTRPPRRTEKNPQGKGKGKLRATGRSACLPTSLRKVLRAGGGECAACITRKNRGFAKGYAQARAT